MYCNSCGGIIGRDCFNPQECAEISYAQEQNQRQEQEYCNLSLESRIVSLETKIEELSNKIKFLENQHV